MSRIIRLTQDVLNSCIEEFSKALGEMSLVDGKISFTKTFDSNKEKAVVYFDPVAYTKMVALIKGFDKEVAWHGTARRIDEEKNEFQIDDIFVYPQEVTGASVVTDQNKYQDWLYGLDDDKFNNLRFQGHSHVNMSVSPSGVDTQNQEQIIDQLEGDMFYIFMIWNKSFNVWCKIFDIKKNIMFESSDVTIKLANNGVDLDEFIKEAKGLVSDRPVAAYSNTAKTPSYTSAQMATPKTTVYSVNNEKQANKQEKKDTSDKKQDSTNGKKKTKAFESKDSKVVPIKNKSDEYYGYSKSVYEDPFYADEGYGYSYNGYHY